MTRILRGFLFQKSFFCENVTFAFKPLILCGLYKVMNILQTSLTSLLKEWKHNFKTSCFGLQNLSFRFPKPIIWQTNSTCFEDSTFFRHENCRRPTGIILYYTTNLTNLANLFGSEKLIFYNNELNEFYEFIWCGKADNNQLNYSHCSSARRLIRCF